MDPKLYKAAMEGNIAVLKQHKEKLQSQLTPNKNTVLQVATLFGQINCVMEILNMFPSMYRQVNSRGDSSLHIAAREGHQEIVRALIEYANALDEELEDGIGTAKEMLRMTNEDGETALHEAVRNHHPTVVQLLTREDPEFCYPGNDAEETPLYLAAERGYVGLVFVILEICKAPAHGGPGGRTALHSSVIHGHEGCTKKLLDWKPCLAKETDIHGFSPLHYAAHFGYLSMANLLLKVDKTVAYSVDKDQKRTPLHIAASGGHVTVMEELIFHCPDCWEMADGSGQNILHIAVKSKNKRVIKFILRRFSLISLINQKDNDGNTPLHLLSAFGYYESNLIKHLKVDKMAFNKEALTPLDVVYSEKYAEPWGFTERKLVGAGAVQGKRNVIRRDKEQLTSKEKLLSFIPVRICRIKGTGRAKEMKET